jgi:hypothetical protein
MSVRAQEDDIDEDAVINEEANVNEEGDAQTAAEVIKINTTRVIYYI